MVVDSQSKMKFSNTFYYLILFIILTSPAISCWFEDACAGDFTVQPIRLGTCDINVFTTSDTLSVGDSIRFMSEIPAFVIDSISGDTVEIEEIEISFFVTRIAQEPFEIPLIEVFDQYFDISVQQGIALNPYDFQFEEKNKLFLLDFLYICKKPLRYSIPVVFQKIAVTAISTHCIQGDQDTWSARSRVLSTYNLSTTSNYFEFIVK